MLQLSCSPDDKVKWIAPYNFNQFQILWKISINPELKNTVYINSYFENDPLNAQLCLDGCQLKCKKCLGIRNQEIIYFMFCYVHGNGSRVH